VHKDTNFKALVKGKTSVLRPPLTTASKFVSGNQGLKKKYESMIQVLRFE
jgi:hypothetical protein